MLKCKICKRYFNHLGSHIWHKHKILAKEYKEMFELPYSLALITGEIKEKIKTKVNLWKTWKENFKHSKKYQFKKGCSGLHRTSKSERKAIIKRIKEVNKKRLKLSLCPVCKIKFHHVESHLYNAHKLIRVD